MRTYVQRVLAGAAALMLLTGCTGDAAVEPEPSSSLSRTGGTAQSEAELMNEARPDLAGVLEEAWLMLGPDVGRLPRGDCAMSVADALASSTSELGTVAELSGQCGGSLVLWMEDPTSPTRIAEAWKGSNLVLDQVRAVEYQQIGTSCYEQGTGAIVCAAVLTE